MLKDMTGQRFGLLKVVSIAESTRFGYMWNCECDCGNKTKVLGTNLRRGNTKSCGCLHSIETKRIGTKHGDNKRGNVARLYRCWADMKTRTMNGKTKSAKNYKNKGVCVCDSWKDYKNFKKWAEDNGYNDALTLDRINPRGNYCPENCRWATRKEQARNKRGTVKYKNVPVVELCEKAGISYRSVMASVYKARDRGINKNKIFKKYFSKLKIGE